MCVQASLPAIDIQQSLRGVDPHSEQYAHMPDGEQFVAQLCAGATMLSARVGALVFMMRFDEAVGDLKPVSRPEVKRAHLLPGYCCGDGGV